MLKDQTASSSFPQPFAITSCSLQILALRWALRRGFRLGEHAWWVFLSLLPQLIHSAASEGALRYRSFLFFRSDQLSQLTPVWEGFLTRASVKAKITNSLLHGSVRLLEPGKRCLHFLSFWLTSHSWKWLDLSRWNLLQAQMCGHMDVSAQQPGRVWSLSFSMEYLSLHRPCQRHSRPSWLWPRPEERLWERKFFSAQSHASARDLPSNEHVAAAELYSADSFWAEKGSICWEFPVLFLGVI